MIRHREPHTLAGAYAMDAISAPDRIRFERHLARCGECAQEIASLRETTAMLATATAVTPPPDLKERVMAAAAMTRQRPPATVPADEAARRPGTWRSGTWRSGTWRSGTWRSGVRRAATWLASQGWRVRLTVAVAGLASVAVLAAAVVFGTSNGTMRQQLQQAQASSQQVDAVLTARDAIMMTGAVAGGGTVTIVMSHAMGELVFTAAGLHALPATRGYELWLIGATGDRPVGVLKLGRHQMIGPVIAAGLRSGDHLALAAEPASGTSRPTTPMMLDLPL